MANDIINIENLIKVIRGQQVILDKDLATLYGVETRTLNQAVKRNIDRFPEDFMFQLNKEEFENWKSQFVISNSTVFLPVEKARAITMGARKKPYAFTEQGVAMLSSVLRSQTAVAVNIQIMRAFVSMRRFISNNKDVLQRLSTMEYHQLDNYVDDTVLTLLDKRENGVSASIYTQQISRQFRLDLDRHNAQYAPIEVGTFRLSHDRFLCIDDDVYHIGASIKDLGKKWFGFSKMEILSPAELIERINRTTAS